MFKRIIFTSSYSSQIGSFLALKEYQLNIKSYDQKNNILIVQINTKNDLQCKYSFFNEYSSLLSQSGYVFTVFKVNNFIKRIIVYFLIILINNFFNKTKIELWEPRPEWINSLFKTKFIKLPRILRNKKINYY